MSSVIRIGTVSKVNYEDGTIEVAYEDRDGSVTDEICVVSNALIIRANYPEIDITVDASCCAGVTPDTHNAALATMKMCQIEVIGENNEV